MDRGAWWATVHAITRVRHDWMTKPPPALSVCEYFPTSWHHETFRFRLCFPTTSTELTFSKAPWFLFSWARLIEIKLWLVSVPTATGQRSLAGYSPWGRKESDMTEQLHSLHTLITGEGNGNPLQYSCLENPLDRGTWWAMVHGVTQSQIRLKWLSMPCYWCVTASRLPRQTEETGVCTTQARVPHTCIPSVSVHLSWDFWFQSQHHRIPCSLLHSSVFVTPFSGCEKPGLIIIIHLLICSVLVYA